jgi:hypothetical protein
MLNPAEAIKEFEPELEFKVNLTEDDNAKANVIELAKTAPGPMNAFQPGTLRAFPKTEALKNNRMQSPPGTDPTKNEVNDLVDKMLQLKINKVSLEQSPWALQWTPRESELMENTVIRAEVQRQSEERAKALQSYLRPDNGQPQPAPQAQNYQQGYGQGQRNQGYQQQGYRPHGNNAQGYQQGQGQGQNGQGNQYGQSSIAGMACWVCDKSGHQKNNCPTLRAFINNGWCFLDDRSTLNWGTQQSPQGRITNLGTRLWAETIASEIKRRWLKRDIDPLTVKSEFLTNQFQASPIENNAISVQLIPDNDGALPVDVCTQFWDISDALTKNDRTTFETECNSISSATVANVDSRKHTGRSSQGPTGVQKPPTILRRASTEQIPHLRGHKNREDEYFINRQPSERTVHFEDKVPQDTEMKDIPSIPERQSKQQKAGSEGKERYLKKHRIVEKLEPDTQGVIQQILDTPVQLPLKTLIGNMPDVRKKLFQAGYTPEEFEKLTINVLHADLSSREPEEHSDNKPQVSALTIGTLPNYVLVEAIRGQVTECFSLGAEHWTDPEISHVEQHIQGEDEPGAELISDPEFKEPASIRREYDKAAGVEHLRRDCPKVPIEIQGTSFLTLLDSGAELNTMRRATAEKAMLPITSMPRIMRAAKMVTANGSTEGFGGIVWGVPIRIGRIEVRTNFFILEHCTNPIILGNPFLTDARARIEYAATGLTYCRIYSEDGEHSTKFVCTRGDRINAPGRYAGPLAGNDKGL